ncbi:MAG: ABC-F family ATP-binding cassette domain-containing protein [Peptococcaceae bacterium]|nr:ABC-F family ATP-binding cassette domain-containing protein [Peptococcaceae bacterium]
MIILQGKHLKKSYITDLIFENVDFNVQEGEKVGLVGPNGTGKSTLFRCITGEESFDEGQLSMSARHTMGYMEQMPEFAPGFTLLDAVMEMFNDIFAMRDQLRHLEQRMGQVDGDALEHLLEQYSNLTHQYEDLGGFSCESRAKGIIKGLGFHDDDFNREIACFSGGEKTRASLARLLVREPDLLLLDEPTNHLDLEALDWLEGYLRNYKGAVLVISHDRYFLDQVTTRTLEMNHHMLKSYAGNYSRYVDLKAEQEMAQMRAYEKQQAEIAKTEEYIRKYRAGIKSKQARGREKQLSRVERLDAVQSNKSMMLHMHDVSGTGEMVLEIRDLSMAYPDKVLFRDFNETVYKGEKIGLIGGNGVGKSTILKIIMGQLEPASGTVRLGSRVKVSYYDQEHRQLNPNNKIINEIVYQYDVTLNEARDLLAQVLFFGEDVEKRIGDLSGGEKARVALLKIILEEPNLLIMDEPTNHLDIASKEIVEQFLDEFPGTVFMVSHDRYLLDAVCTRTIVLEDQKFMAYLGNYSYYKQKRAELERIAREKQEEAEEKARRQNPKQKAAPAQPKINKAKVKKEIEQLEEQIQQGEARSEELSALLADGATYQDEEKSRLLVAEYKELEEQIPLWYEKWEELQLLLE